MGKETEKRLIQTLEFLEEPQGARLPTIFRKMNHEGPQVSVAKLMHTLKGCVDKGSLKVADGRVKLRQGSAVQGSKAKVEKYLMDTKIGVGKAIPKCPLRKSGIAKSPKMSKPVSVMGANSAEAKLPDCASERGSEPRAGTTGGGGGGSGGGEEGLAVRHRSNACKPRCRTRTRARAAQRCPRTRRRRRQRKCGPKRGKGKRTRRRRRRRSRKKGKIQPYCRKPKSRPSSKC